MHREHGMALCVVSIKLWLHVKYNYFEIILVFFFTSNHRQWLRVK